jgi:hypothetical protein
MLTCGQEVGAPAVAEASTSHLERARELLVKYTLLLPKYTKTAP